MGFTLDISIPVFTVFIQGLLSFFSPCVLPLIPLYIGYLSGGTMKRDENGNTIYKKSKVLINTFFFVLGISFAFILLGIGVSALGTFLNRYQFILTRVGSIIIIFLGIYQLGLLGNSKLLGNTHKLPFQMEKLAMSPITALVMGFTFSFAWTPCVGPVLTSVLLMAASAETQMTGLGLILVYTLGFVIPFVLVGIFTTSVLNFFKNHMNVVKYTVRIGGLLMIFMGILMFTGKMNAITGYLSETQISSEKENVENEAEESIPNESQEEEEEPQNTTIPAPDFTLTDQYGNIHTLADYKGKTVFMNFWATGCGPCKSELPDIQKIYEQYSQEESDVVILTFAAPNYGNETDESGIISFLDENEYTFPVLMDTTTEVFMAYGISAFPTTYMIDVDGNVYGYINGAISEDIMHSIINQTMGKEQ